MRQVSWPNGLSSPWVCPLGKRVRSESERGRAAGGTGAESTATGDMRRDLVAGVENAAMRPAPMSVQMTEIAPSGAVCFFISSIGWVNVGEARAILSPFGSRRQFRRGTEHFGMSTAPRWLHSRRGNCPQHV